MKRLIHLATLSAALIACPLAVAQTQAVAPGTRPANATGICKDGTYSTDATKSGACRGHHGVQEWYTAAAAVPATPAPTSPAAQPPVAQQAPAAPSTPSPTTQVRTQSAAAAQSAGQSDTPPATQSIGPQLAPVTPAAAPIKKGPRSKLANTPEAPGGGPGLVWLNSSSKVYHCPGTDFYGKTKKGSYISEADAKSKGAHGVGGKTCTQ